MPPKSSTTRPSLDGRRRRRLGNVTVRSQLKSSQISTYTTSNRGTYYNYYLICLLLPLLLCSLKFKLTETRADEQRPITNVILNACKDGILELKSLREFKQFIEEFKLLTEDSIAKPDSAGLARCLRYRRAILDLEPLLVTENVCDAAQIDALINYHNTYFKSGHRRLARALSRQRQSPTKQFFSKYAIQVAHTCKSNLIKNLETSRKLLSEQAKTLEDAKEMVYSERPSLRMNIKLIEEQPDGPATANVKPISETELTLGEYREALTRLKRPEDILTFERAECENMRNRRVEIAADKVQMFFKPALICLKLAQYYSSSMLSIARLANYGYQSADEELDVKLADSQLVKDWIVATQVCEPMLYMRTDKIENEIATIDTCSERIVAIETMVYEDTIEELASEEKLDEWLEKSEATRHHAQKIMKSAMRKLAKVSLMRELRKPGGLSKRNMFGTGIKSAVKAAAAGASTSLQGDMLKHSRQVSQHLRAGIIDVSSLKREGDEGDQHSDAKSFETLIRIMSEEGTSEEKSTSSSRDGEDEDNSAGDGAVSMFDPLTSLASSITVIAIMLTFEWLFFVVMTLAARICHKLNFNFDNLLTFPPKVLSWSDANFVKYNDNLEKIDEDDFFDYDELNPEEQRQRDLLAKVFGKPPPSMFRI